MATPFFVQLIVTAISQLLLTHKTQNMERRNFGIGSKVRISLLLSLAIIFAACSSDSDDSEARVLDVSPTSITLNGNTSSGSFYITSNTIWTISVNADWLSLSTLSGKSNSQVTVTAKGTPSNRTATITVQTEGITRQIAVMQTTSTTPVNPGGDTPGTDTPSDSTQTSTPTLSVTPSSITLDDNGEATFSIYSNTSWTISIDQTWCDTWIKSGTGNRYLTTVYTKQENPSTSPRTATITVKSATLTATLTVTQKGNDRETTGTHEGHDWVDLGLSVCWATTNLGSSTPGGYGSYLRWSTSAVDWGGSWRLPTWEECQELISSSNTTKTWERQDGHFGHRITGKNGNSIFLPAAGWKTSFTSGVIQEGETAHYWSSTLDETGESAWTMWVISAGILGQANSTSVGYLYNIRPVKDK